jgi:uncharacterized small protein (DUF1192 family)
MKRFLVLGALVSTLMLAGCASGAGSLPDTYVGAADGVDTGMVTSEGMKANADSTVASDASGTSLTDQSRSVIKNASVAVAVEHPLDVAPELAGIAAGAGGYVQDSSNSPASDYQSESAYATLRIPANKLDATTAKVLALGTFVSSTQSESDVTLQVTDVEARIASLSTSIDRLTALMEEATNTADLLAAENALAQRQAELDSLVSQRDFLSNQVDLATLSVSVTATSDAAPTSQSFWDGLSQGWNSVVNAGSVLVVTVGFLLPWLGILAVLALVAAAITRFFSRLARQRLATPHTSDPESRD